MSDIMVRPPASLERPMYRPNWVLVRKLGCTRKQFILGCLAVVAVFLLMLGMCSSRRERTSGFALGAASTPSTAATSGTPYTVRRGDYLWKIADANGVSRMELLLANEGTLNSHYEGVIAARDAKERAALAKLSWKDRRFIARVRDKQSLTREEQRLLRVLARRTGFDWRITGYFGNPKYGKMSPANTLTPGMALSIPSAKDAPQDIVATVAAMPGSEVVVVIDDSGSMSEDRMTVARWYASAARQKGKTIKKIVLYVDGEVRTYDADLNLEAEMRTAGGVENTQEALLDAEDFGGDAVVLITDEPGDDWSSFGQLRLRNSLPPLHVEYLDAAQPKELVALATATKGGFKNRQL